MMAHPVPAEDVPVSAAPLTEPSPPVADAVAPPLPRDRSFIPFRVAPDPAPLSVGVALQVGDGYFQSQFIRTRLKRNIPTY